MAASTERRILVDTNIIIYLYRAHDPALAASISKRHVAVNHIIATEALGWPDISPSEEAYITAFCQAADLLELSQAVFNRTVAIRKLKKIALPDAIIAATALVHNAELWTANDRDFSDIADLHLYNPFKR